jgi:mitogen-activated protein kinase 1/3
MLGEMFSNRPMFPGKNYVEQLGIIVKMLGKPSPEESQWVTSEKSREYLLSLPHSVKVPITQ